VFNKIKVLGFLARE